MNASVKPPDWLDGPATAVLDDPQGAEPIPGIAVVATRIENLNGLSLGIVEASMAEDELPQLDDDLDPDVETEWVGGNWVPRADGTASGMDMRRGHNA